MICFKYAWVAELADAIDLRSIAVRHAGSTPAPGKIKKQKFLRRGIFVFWCGILELVRMHFVAYSGEPAGKAGNSPRLCGRSPFGGAKARENPERRRPPRLAVSARLGSRTDDNLQFFFGGKFFEKSPLIFIE